MNRHSSPTKSAAPCSGPKGWNSEVTTKATRWSGSEQRAAPNKMNSETTVNPIRDQWAKPTATSGRFYRHYSYEPAEVIEWGWSSTFSQWGALVRFPDGKELFTWPQPAAPARPWYSPRQQGGAL